MTLLLKSIYLTSQSDYKHDIMIKINLPHFTIRRQLRHYYQNQSTSLHNQTINMTLLLKSIYLTSQSDDKYAVLSKSICLTSQSDDKYDIIIIKINLPYFTIRR